VVVDAVVELEVLVDVLHPAAANDPIATAATAIHRVRPT
jgi:hypothetical protein